MKRYAAGAGALGFFWAVFSCSDIKLPELRNNNDTANVIYLTPPFVISPSELGTKWQNAKPFTINPNPDSPLRFNAYKDDGNTYHVTLSGAVRSGLPEALRLCYHPNGAFDDSQPGVEPLSYRYGDFAVQLYPDPGNYKPDYSQQVPNPNLTPRNIRPDATTRYTAVTIAGILEEKDRKGNRRDLERGITITQHNEALDLYAKDYNADGAADGSWSMTLNGAASPPVMETKYWMNPEYFSDKDPATDKYLLRGGVPFLIKEDAADKTIRVEIRYLDGGVTRLEIDYSGVTFVDVYPSTFWFYSDYQRGPLPIPVNEALPRALPSRLASLEQIEGASGLIFKDPAGTMVTGPQLTAPAYKSDPAANDNGPFPYFFPAEAPANYPARNDTSGGGGSKTYENGTGQHLTSGSPKITLLPVFHPANASFRTVEWTLDNLPLTPDLIKSLITDNTVWYWVTENNDGSITVNRKTNAEYTYSVPVSVDITASVTMGEGLNRVTMTLNAKIHAAAI